MADVANHIIRKIEGDKALRNVPQPIIEAVVNQAVLQFHELVQDGVDIVGAMERCDVVWCDTCDKQMDRRDVQHGPDLEDFCVACHKQFWGDDEG